MESIKNVILNGLLADIKIAEQSFRLNKKINELYNENLQPLKKSIATIMSDLSYTEMVLSLARIYDTPNKKYPTRCLKQLYLIIKESNYQIALNDNKAESILNLPYFGFEPSTVELLRTSSDYDFNKRTTVRFEDIEINEPLFSCITELKDIRDKLLVHNEDAQVNSFIDYNKFEKLLEHAKNVASFYAITYCGFRLKSGNNYYLADNTIHWENDFQRFIEE